MLAYDRRAPEGLLAALRPGGWAASLAEYGRSGQFALDLQLRGYPKKSAGHWATLYAGLTKVLDLHYLPSKGFRLDVHKTWKVHGWNEDWEKYRPQGFDHVEWRTVEDYLETVIPKVDARFMVEGSVQSAVSGFQSRNLTVIDREVAVSFDSQNEKDRITSELADPLLAALEMPGPSWWKGRPSHLGGECDALAVDADGSLLAIEIKPAKSVGHYSLGPYTGPPLHQPVEQVGVVDTRRSRDHRWNGRPASRAWARPRDASRCAVPVRVRPVLAIQRRASDKVLDRFRTSITC